MAYLQGQMNIVIISVQRTLVIKSLNQLRKQSTYPSPFLNL